VVSNHITSRTNRSSRCRRLCSLLHEVMVAQILCPQSRSVDSRKHLGSGSSGSLFRADRSDASTLPTRQSLLVKMTAMLWIDLATFRRCSRPRILGRLVDPRPQNGNQNQSAASGRTRFETWRGAGRTDLKAVRLHAWHSRGIYVNGATNGRGSP
jgi:hypothetical protein